VTQDTQLESRVQRWTNAGVIDAPAAGRILAFEAGQERKTTLRWPVILAMAFGAILLAAGVTLFVAAHWSELSPASRFSLVLMMAGLFHIGGAAFADRFPVLSTTLHAVGTAVLGAAIFLTAQIFNLHQNWPTGVLLWTIGAAAGYLLLRDWVQAAFCALLAPAWLISQWEVTNEGRSGSGRPLALGLILISVCYLSARTSEHQSAARRALVVIGSIALLPCVLIAIATAEFNDVSYRYGPQAPVPRTVLLVGWTVALAGPSLLAWFLRGRAAWANLLWAAWAYALILSATYSNSFRSTGNQRDLLATLALYALCEIGSVALVAWGLHEKRKERLNLGVLAFALSVLFFYFDSFMGKLGRSASLLLLGVLCLTGGYALEITRRKLMVRMETSQ
jgi:uncharacterized membrane protein